MNQDYFLSAEDALTFGIVDEVITKRHPLDEKISLTNKLVRGDMFHAPDGF